MVVVIDDNSIAFFVRLRGGLIGIKYSTHLMLHNLVVI